VAGGALSSPGQGRARRKVTLRDVAERAGVHVSTASRALDSAATSRIGASTTERVRVAAAGLGYSRDLLASSLKRGATKTVGVVIANLDNPYNSRVIRGIARVLEADDFVPLVAETGRSRERFERLLDHLVQRRVDAVITSAIHLDGAEMLDRLLPVVLAGRGLRCPEDVSAVGYNDLPLSRFVSPPLTTIEMSAEELGAEAARMVLGWIEDPSRRGRTVQLSARLIVRRSTGPVD
jgi:DNA-binding LacI/PurR family transcriptional regulator